MFFIFEFEKHSQLILINHYHLNQSAFLSEEFQSLSIFVYLPNMDRPYR